MNEPNGFWDAVRRIRSTDDRFAAEAYGFLMDGMEYTLRALGEQRHVHADELLQGACRFAHSRYGVMSYTLLERWGIKTTGDIGDIVFHLVDAGVLSRRTEDRRGDFDNAFDLRDVLENGYFERRAGNSDAA